MKYVISHKLRELMDTRNINAYKIYQHTGISEEVNNTEVPRRAELEILYICKKNTTMKMLLLILVIPVIFACKEDEPLTHTVILKDSLGVAFYSVYYTINGKQTTFPVSEFRYGYTVKNVPDGEGITIGLYCFGKPWTTCYSGPIYSDCRVLVIYDFKTSTATAIQKDLVR